MHKPEFEMYPLLVVFPGREGRRPVLEQILNHTEVVCLVPRDEMFQWATKLGVRCYTLPEGQVEGKMKDWFKKVHAIFEGCNFRGVLCYDEFGLELASFLADRFNVPGTPYSTVRRLRNKLWFREYSKTGSVPTPWFAMVECLTKNPVQDETWSLTSDLDSQTASSCTKDSSLQFPCIVKPVKGAGSWNVRLIDNHDDFETLLPQLEKKFQGSGFPSEIKQAGLMLESVIDGDEIDVDGFCYQGTPIFWIISYNKETDGVFFQEQGGIYPADGCLSKMQINQVVLTLKTLFSTFKGVHGCFHFEAKVTDEICVPIEVNLRVGGAECPCSVKAATGVNLVDFATRLSLSSEKLCLRNLYDLPEDVCQKTVFFHPDFTFGKLEIPEHRVVATKNFLIATSGFLTSLRVKNDCLISKEVQKVLFTASVGKYLEKDNGSMSCVGWLAVGGDTLEEAESNLARGAAEVVFVTASQ